MIYLDSSALVKRYVAEDGSDAVDRLLVDHPYAAASRLAYPEILSALNRKHRAREFSARFLGKMIAAFESDWGKLFILEFDEELLPIIKQAIRKHAIRGADAVHLASAMWLRSVLKEDVIFVCADAKLLGAARAERLLAFDPAQGVDPPPPSRRRATGR
ncbi:MAG: type II toxin-antitoxin system VapC family toxin [Desulfobacteria bacterium]